MTPTKEHSGGLRPGQEVLLINGLSARLSPTDMGGLLGSLPGGDVTFVVREPAPDGGATGRATFRLGSTGRVALAKSQSHFKSSKTKASPPSRPSASGVCAMTTDIGDMSHILRQKGVAEQDWFRIYTAVGGELIAAADKLIVETHSLKNISTSVPFGSGHIAMISVMTNATAFSKSTARVAGAQQTCALAAMKAEQQANSILAKYGVGVVPVMEVFEDESIATGLEFRPI
jgi:hypothetical protein